MATPVVERRSRKLCPVCSRSSHHTCVTCGNDTLIGFKGVQGLFEHDTQLAHVCQDNNSRDTFKGDGNDYSNGDANQKGYSGGGAAGGGQSDKGHEQGQDNRGGEGQGQGQGQGEQGGQSESGSGQQGQGQKGNGSLKIAITGGVSFGTYAEVQKMIEQAGHELHKSVSETTDFLVSNDAEASTKKLEEAKKHQTKIIDEQQLKELLEQGKYPSQWQRSLSEDDPNREQGKQDPLAHLFDLVRQFDENMLEENREEMEKALRDAMDEAEADTNTVQVERDDGTTYTIEGAHEQMPTLLKLLASRKPVFIVGPAGSGKTKSAEQASDALGLHFYPKSVGPATTEFNLFGYMDAAGNYVPGIVFKPFVEGGLLLLDEMDAANPACLTALNTALANEYCSFPHGVFKKHDDFVVIASGNTYGKGADRQYVGRNQLDDATLNRFFVLNWDYDEKLERRLSSLLAKDANDVNIQTWCLRVQKIREVAAKIGVRLIAGTRDILDGAAALQQGFTIQEVEDMRFWNSAPREAKEKIYAGAGWRTR